MKYSFPRQAYDKETNLIVTITGWGSEGLMRCTLPDTTVIDILSKNLMELEETHCCPHCGSPDILYPVWQNPNTKEIKQWIDMVDGYCRSCTRMIVSNTTIKLSDYLKSKQIS